MQKVTEELKRYAADPSLPRIELQEAAEQFAVMALRELRGKLQRRALEVSVAVARFVEFFGDDVIQKGAGGEVSE